MTATRLGFAAELAAFAEKTKLSMDVVVRKTALDLGAALVQKSPVDTGRFKGNWQTGVGSVNESIDSANDPSGTVVLTRLSAAVADVKAGGVLSSPTACHTPGAWSTDGRSKRLEAWFASPPQSSRPMFGTR